MELQWVQPARPGELLLLQLQPTWKLLWPHWLPLLQPSKTKMDRLLNHYCSLLPLTCCYYCYSADFSSFDAVVVVVVAAAVGGDGDDGGGAIGRRERRTDDPAVD